MSRLGEHATFAALNKTGAGSHAFDSSCRDDLVLMGLEDLEHPTFQGRKKSIGEN